MGKLIQLQNVRCSYPHLFQPRAIEPGKEAKYSCAFIVPKNDPVWSLVTPLAEEALLETFGANRPGSLKPLPIRDGDLPDVGHPGCWVLNASAKQQPIVVDQQVQPVIDPGLVYPGCYVNANLAIFAYNMPLSKGVTFGLNGVQYAGPGDRLDNRPTAEQMFQPAAPGTQPQGPAAPVNPPSAQPAPVNYPSAQPAPAVPAGGPATFDEKLPWEN